MTSPVTTTAPTFSTFAATENNGSVVEIPADRAADFANAATYFSGKTNRHTLTANLPTEGEAKTFARQARQYANSHGMSTSPVRSGNSVTFRFARTRDGGTAAGEVTVSHLDTANGAETVTNVADAEAMALAASAK